MNNPPAKDGGDTLEQLLDAVMDGSADGGQLERVREMLRNDPAAMDAYVDQMRMHAMLQWRHGQVVSTNADVTHAPVLQMPRVAGNRTGGWRWAVAAGLVLVGALVAIIASRGGKGMGGTAIEGREALGEVIEARGASWASGQVTLESGSKVQAGEVAISAGKLRLKLKSDVIVTLAGPAKVQLVSAMRVKALAGRVTARVGPTGKGFTIEAPAADVVDWGTEFGVQVNEAGHTDVVVFEGEVDLHRKAASGAGTGAPQRMRKGEGLQVTAGGAAERIVEVGGKLASGEWNVGGGAGHEGSVITSVRDNLRDPASGKFYRIVERGLEEDAPAYVDRSYEWNGITAAGIPAELKGADLVMTFNADKRAENLELMVTLAKPAALYVFLQQSAIPPEWLKRDFVLTEMMIGLDEGPPDMPKLQLGTGGGNSVDRIFTVWRRDVKEPGVVILGDNPPVKSMYGIAAVGLK